MEKETSMRVARRQNKKMWTAQKKEERKRGREGGRREERVIFLPIHAALPIVGILLIAKTGFTERLDLGF